jgi:hypothetical protein
MVALSLHGEGLWCRNGRDSGLQLPWLQRLLSASAMRVRAHERSTRVVDVPITVLIGIRLVCDAASGCPMEETALVDNGPGRHLSTRTYIFVHFPLAIPSTINRNALLKTCENFCPGT